MAMRRALMMAPLEARFDGKGRRRVVEGEITEVRGRDLPLDPNPGGEPLVQVQELRRAEEPAAVARLDDRVDRGIGGMVGRPIMPRLEDRLPRPSDAG